MKASEQSHLEPHCYVFKTNCAFIMNDEEGPTSKALQLIIRDVTFCLSFLKGLATKDHLPKAPICTFTSTAQYLHYHTNIFSIYHDLESGPKVKTPERD